MTTRPRERLYRLLPALYRAADLPRGEPLRALLSIMEEELVALEADTDQLYANWFIETCEDWVVPYLGDLVGVRHLRSAEEGVGSQRAIVANAVRDRRRKGTTAMIEAGAAQVTGWDAKVVPFHEKLAWAQNVNHVRPGVGSANIRGLRNPRDLAGPYDPTSRSADIRRPGPDRGWPNLSTLGVFLWRLRGYSLKAVPAARSRRAADGWHLNPLGTPTALFTAPRRKESEFARASKRHVTAPLHREDLALDLDLARAEGREPDHYGARASLLLYADGAVVPAERIVSADLSAWAPPPAGRVALDPELGRVAFPPGEGPTILRADWRYGFSADLGGGPYPRALPRGETRRVRVAQRPPLRGDEEWLPTLDAGVAAALRAPMADRVVVEIGDSSVYEEAVDWTIPEGTRLEIVAASGERPLLRAQGDLRVQGGASSALVLEGLAIAGGSLRAGGALGEIILRHCTLVPGLERTEDPAAHAGAFPEAPSLVLEAGAVRRAFVERCILGPVLADADRARLVVRDSILDAQGASGGLALGGLAPGRPGPATEIERCTVFGGARVSELLASDSIFTAPVHVLKRQIGAVRACFVPLASVLPRQQVSQPAIAVANLVPPALTVRLREVVPRFSSTRFGDEAYAQLRHDAPPEVRRRAEDGLELGAFQHLRESAREEALRARLDEMLPFGQQATLIYLS